MTLGAALTVIGTYFPSFTGRLRKSDRGDAHISFSQFAVKISGGLRFVLVVGGLLLICGSLGESFYNVDTYQSITGHLDYERLSPNQRDKFLASAKEKYPDEAGDPARYLVTKYRLETALGSWAALAYECEEKPTKSTCHQPRQGHPSSERKRRVPAVQ